MLVGYTRGALAGTGASRLRARVRSGAPRRHGRCWGAGKESTWKYTLLARAGRQKECALHVVATARAATPPAVPASGPAHPRQNFEAGHRCEDGSLTAAQAHHCAAGRQAKTGVPTAANAGTRSSGTAYCKHRAQARVREGSVRRVEVPLLGGLGPATSSVS